MTMLKQTKNEKIERRSNEPITNGESWKERRWESPNWSLNLNSWILCISIPYANIFFILRLSFVYNKVRYHIEISLLTSFTKQRISFYMMRTSIMRELKKLINAQICVQVMVKHWSLGHDVSGSLTRNSVLG